MQHFILHVHVTTVFFHNVRVLLKFWEDLCNILDGIASAFPCIATDVSACGLSVCPCVSVARAANAVGRNEMPFGRDTRVAPSNTVLHGAPVLPEKWGDLRVEIPDRRDQLSAANSKQLH